MREVPEDVFLYTGDSGTRQALEHFIQKHSPINPKSISAMGIRQFLRHGLVWFVLIPQCGGAEVAPASFFRVEHDVRLTHVEAIRAYYPAANVGD